MDHYLPKQAFPRLSYYWPNLLPSCPGCNENKKGDYFPATLQRDGLTDPILKASDAPPCDFSKVLPEVEERLVHPSGEDPEQHLQFEPALHVYLERSKVGRKTNRVFFGGGADKHFAEEMATLSSAVRRALQNPEPEKMIDEVIRLVGYEFYIRAYERFWRSFERGGAGESPLVMP